MVGLEDRLGFSDGFVVGLRDELGFSDGVVVGLGDEVGFSDGVVVGLAHELGLSDTYTIDVDHARSQSWLQPDSSAHLFVSSSTVQSLAQSPLQISTASSNVFSSWQMPPISELAQTLHELIFT